MHKEIAVAPGLLIAMPQLMDPNFHHGVVLMLEHDSNGSFGLVVNQFAGTSVSELLEGIEIQWRGDSEAQAMTGGPVQQETGWILHEPVAELAGEPGTREIVPGLWLSSAPAALARISACPPPRVRFLLGYAGWGPHQLENELAEGAWVNSEVDADFVLDLDPDHMWEEALRRLGIGPGTLAPASGIH
jgi:putative transcriptional regulator